MVCGFVAAGVRRITRTRLAPNAPSRTGIAPGVCPKSDMVCWHFAIDAIPLASRQREPGANWMGSVGRLGKLETKLQE